MQTGLEAPGTDPQPAEGLHRLDHDAEAIALRGVERRFGTSRGDVLALTGLDLDAAHGEVLAVVGPSGCGKSTLLELLAGLADPDAGTVAVGGERSRQARLVACAYMPQRDLLLPWRSGLDNAALALEAEGVRRGEARRRARPLFERFGLAGFAHARPAELSGGMRQRVAFLRTLLAGRPILLLDEPFGALDSITRAAMQEWLAEAMRTEPRTVVLVTHDVREALYLGDRVAVLSPRPGRVVASLRVPFARPRPRRETVTDPSFAALEERALAALEERGAP
jgi:ABC-type nitrate/sulfonate/bicarbonate transport system ATPase subunit